MVKSSSACLVCRFWRSLFFLAIFACASGAELAAAFLLLLLLLVVVVVVVVVVVALLLPPLWLPLLCVFEMREREIPEGAA